MKRRIKNIIAGAAVGATLLGGVAFFFYRRLHKITFIRLDSASVLTKNLIWPQPVRRALVSRQTDYYPR